MGSGEFPADVRAMLQSEGLIVIDEGLTGSITRRHYSGPGIRAALERQGMTGAVAVTGRRVLVWAASAKQIDIPLDDALRSELEVSIDKPGRLMFAFEAHAFDASRKGRVEIRLNTAQAIQAQAALSS